MALDRFVVYVDEKMYERVFLEPEKIQVGQRYELPEQDNPDVEKFKDIKLIVEKIDKGVGGTKTNNYHFRTE